MSQLLQGFGAIIVLLAFVLNRYGKIPSQGSIYGILNLFGSVLLFVSAASGLQYGFMALNATYGLISLITLVRRGAE